MTLLANSPLPHGPAREDAGLHRGLLAWFLAQPRCAGGILWRDLLGRQNATLTNFSFTSVSGWRGSDRPGGLGLCLSSDGTNDSVNADGIAARLTSTRIVTVSFWFCGNPGANKYLFSLGNSADADPFAAIFTDTSTGTNAVGQFRNDASSAGSTSQPVVTINDLRWHFLSLRADGTNYTCRADRTDGPARALPADPITFDRCTLAALGRSTSSGFAGGLFDDVRIWDRALSAGQLDAVMTDALAGYPGTLRRFDSRGKSGAGGATSGGRLALLGCGT